MRRKLLKYHSGFTLLELLIAVGILGVMAMLLAQAFFTTTRSNTKSEILSTVKQNGDFALEVMTRVIRGASEIVSPACDGSSASSLTVKNKDATTTEYKCLSSSGVLRIGSNSSYITGSGVSLTSSDDTCATSSLKFTCETVATVGRSVNISFDLIQKGTPIDQYEKANVPFQTSVTLRNETE